MMEFYCGGKEISDFISAWNPLFI